MAVKATVRAKAELTFVSAKIAAAVAGATAVDNNGSGLSQSVAGRTLRVELEASTPRSVRASLDDWLRCATAASEAARRA